MALKKCRECGGEVSNKAKAFKVLGVIFIMAFISSLLSPFASDSDDFSSSSPTAEKLEIVDVRAAKTGVFIKDEDIRTGPGMDYANDETGELMESETIYVLDEKNGWIKFRVTKQDEGWSAWVRKDLTISIAEINAAREAKFGKRPERSPWDDSVRCVEQYLRSIAHDPDSLKFDNWSDLYYNDEDGWLVRCEYRGKNAFGAYVRNANWFVIRYGRVVSMKDSDAYGL
jgi:hypothetical protein